MTESIDPELERLIREESERTKDLPYPPGTKGYRPNLQRSDVCSIDLSPAEQEELRRVAQSRALPASAMVRSWVLERLEQERSA